MAILVGIGLTACAAAPRPTPVLPGEGDPIALFRDGPLVEGFWELDAHDGLWAEDVAPRAALAAFRDTIRARVGDVSAAAIYAREVARFSGSADEVEAREARNVEKVARGEVGRLRRISALEAAIVDWQIRRVPGFARTPAEFQAFVLRRGARVRVYVAASDTPYPPKPRHVLPQIEKDRADGWTVWAHIHQHTFETTGARHEGLGTPAPSTSDLHFFRMLVAEHALERAFVTNGFETFEITAEEMPRLEARDP